MTSIETLPVVPDLAVTAVTKKKIQSSIPELSVGDERKCFNQIRKAASYILPESLLWNGWPAGKFALDYVIGHHMKRKRKAEAKVEASSDEPATKKRRPRRKPFDEINFATVDSDTNMVSDQQSAKAMTDESPRGASVATRKDPKKKTTEEKVADKGKSKKENVDEKVVDKGKSKNENVGPEKCKEKVIRGEERNKNKKEGVNKEKPTENKDTNVTGRKVDEVANKTAVKKIK